MFNRTLAAAGVSHPVLAELVTYGRVDDWYYAASVHHEGTPLDRQQPPSLPPDKLAKYVLQIAFQLAGGLRAVHAAGITRPIFSTGDLILRDDGSAGDVRVVLSNWMFAGLVAALEAATQEHTIPLMIRDLVLLTPEELGRPDQVSLPADFYALGILLYRCAAGKDPFVVHDLGDLINIHYKQTDRPLPGRELPVTPVVQRLIQRLLARDPTQRPAGASFSRHRE